jgi:hypothetical protein
MTHEAIAQFATQWVEEHPQIAEHTPLPQILAMFGFELQKEVMGEIGEIVLGEAT